MRISAEYTNGADLEIDGIYYRIVLYLENSQRHISIKTLINDQWNHDAIIRPKHMGEIVKFLKEHWNIDLEV